MESGGLKGTEEFRLEKTSSGYRLTSKTAIDRGGRSMALAQEQSLGADWGLLRCKLEASVGGQTRTIEAWRDGEKIEMRASGGGIDGS